MEGCRELQLHLEHVEGRQGQILAVLDGLHGKATNKGLGFGKLGDFCRIDEIHIGDQLAVAEMLSLIDFLVDAIAVPW